MTCFRVSPLPCNQIHSIHSMGGLYDQFALIFTVFTVGGIVDLFALIFTAFTVGGGGLVDLFALIFTTFAAFAVFTAGG